MKIKLPRGFRELKKSDDLSSFDSGKPILDNYVRNNASSWIDEHGHLFVVHGSKGKIWGLMDLEIYDKYIELAVIARNKNVKLPENIKVGTRLERLAQNITKQLGKKEIRLEAKEDVHDWYNNRLGYQQYSEKCKDPTFGELVPKRKFL